jgi:hypothetical protein
MVERDQGFESPFLQRRVTNEPVPARGRISVIRRSLAVEPMPQSGIFEYTRQRAEAIRSQNSSQSQPDFT